MVLTEAHIDSLDALGGHTLSHAGYNSEGKSPSERLVLLWSNSAWTEIPLPPDLQSNGGALLGQTLVGKREVFVLGICIPWHMSPGVPPQERVKPWAQHERFLHLLQPAISDAIKNSPLIIAGDFNRFIPRAWGPKAPYALLEETFANVRIVTSGLLTPLNLPTIDHVAASGPIAARSVRGLSRFETDGRPRSDHFGVLVDFEWIPPNPPPG